MKSFSKVCLIFSGSVIAIGLILCISGSIIGGGRLFIDAVTDGRFSFGKYYRPISAGSLKDINEEFSDITDISLEIAYGELIFDTYEGDVVKVDAANVRNKFKCSKNGGELVISDGNYRKYYSNYHPYITVLVPESKLNEVDINIGAGYINVNNLYTKDLAVNVGAGDFTGESFNVDSSDIKVAAGSLVIDDINSNEMELDCGVGSVSIIGNINNDIEVKCAMGSIVLELDKEESYYNYNVSCGMGSVSIEDNNFSGLGHNKHINNGSDNLINIDCGMGDVTVYFEKSI